MILQHFTWQQFLIAATILTAIWYVAIILIFYKLQIQDLLNGRRQADLPPEPLSHAWDEEFEGEPLGNDDDLMGKPALPEGMTRLSMAQFGFAPRLSEPAVEQEVKENWEEDFESENTNDNRKRQQSVVPDVLEELKSIFHILETQQGTKHDFISLFALVSAKYPKIKGTANQQALNEYIRENVLFPISDKELSNLWN
ncbi:hypothetical protein [Mucilaginibacter sp.]|jgi:hypothetical protein|uniref:hypothetical protein n=1 Tax=Mucilaginibacter sp. TaxID=1882438 RepID=UPI0026117DFD|nr:hypothetical protein [Mucilaginibacter sp.]MDB4926582.1 hypothetical protein [Mucilaginibacter sp.]